MDESKIVGLITGTRAYPQDDLSPESKAGIVFHALQGVMKKEIENLVTGAFRSIREFTTKSSGGLRLVYETLLPDAMMDTKAAVIFVHDAPVPGVSQKSNRFILHRILLTAKGDLVWWTEKYTTRLRENVVTESGFLLLDPKNIQVFFGVFPELLSRIQSGFVAIATHAIEMREKKQERTRAVREKLARMNSMIGTVKFL